MACNIIFYSPRHHPSGWQTFSAHRQKRRRSFQRFPSTSSMFCYGENPSACLSMHFQAEKRRLALFKKSKWLRGIQKGKLRNFSGRHVLKIHEQLTRFRPYLQIAKRLANFNVFHSLSSSLFRNSFGNHLLVSASFSFLNGHEQRQ